ncbi:MAG: putative Ig domain-containing protein [Burkholderiales bacterium]|nr:putative Ig domain-containing protein [Burkholderiales bacterium]
MQNVALLTRDSAPNAALLERTPAAVAPTITTTALPAGVIGVAYSQTLQRTGTAPITWSIQVGALPAGLTLNAATGVISGAPTAPVAATFTVRATNSAGSTDKALGILVPNEGSGGTAPVVTTVTLVPVTAAVAAGSTTDLIVAVEDQDGSPISGISGAAETTSPVNATAQWLAPADDSGQATIRVSGIAQGSASIRAVVDGVQSNSTAVAITAGPVSPTITTTALPAGTVGAAYSQTLAASGDAPITWSIQAGALPAGLTLNASTGVISGTPTGSGSFAFTVRATNTAGFAQQALSLSVTALSGGAIVDISGVEQSAPSGLVVGATAAAPSFTESQAIALAERNEVVLVIGDPPKAQVFDFRGGISAGENIDTVSVTVTTPGFEGLDPAPENFALGPPGVAGELVVQNLYPTVAGVRYLVRCVVNTSAGQRLIREAHVRVLERWRTGRRIV